MRLFECADDYRLFLKIAGEAQGCVPMRWLAYCLMPNHFHMVLWPRKDGDMGEWMQWLCNTHVRRYHRHYRSSGHIWQGRFRACLGVAAPIQARAGRNG
jgi:putative transposase